MLAENNPEMARQLSLRMSAQETQFFHTSTDGRTYHYASTVAGKRKMETQTHNGLHRINQHHIGVNWPWYSCRSEAVEQHKSPSECSDKE